MESENLFDGGYTITFVNSYMDKNNKLDVSFTNRNNSRTEATDANEDNSITEESLAHIIACIRMCFLPIILAGTLTNMLNFVVLCQKEMRTLSTSVYLFALAVADLGVMYFELFRVWFEWTNLVDPNLYFSDTYCKLMNFSNGVLRDFANWLIACLTLERVVMVASPYRAKNFCTVRRAKIVTWALLVAICFPHTHCLVFSVAQKNIRWVCWEDPNSVTASVLAAIVEFVVGYIIVFVVVTLNVILVVLIYRRRLPCLSFNKRSSMGLNSHLSGQRASYNKRLTRTLLLVALVFLVCETPRMTMSFFLRFNTRTAVRRIILNASYVLSGINHACNFFIYILSSPRFRQLLIQALPCKKSQVCIHIELENTCCIHDIPQDEFDLSVPIALGEYGKTEKLNNV